MDQRVVQLRQWLSQKLDDAPGFDATNWELLPVSGDASFRRYFRAESAGNSWIAVDAPPEKEDSQPFIDVAQALENCGVAVPHIYAYDLQQGFMLLSDFGDQLYLDLLNHDTVEELYAKAIDALLAMQQCPGLKNKSLPAYDRELLKREVELFRQWFVLDLLQMELEEREHQLLDQLFEFLIQAALTQPTAFVHRDYHSRNIMYRGESDPGIIDFQDAVMGPVTYDLVSLLRDCYIAWPDDKVYAWVNQFRGHLQSSGMELPDEESFARWFDLMGAQRHLKAIGIFARLKIRDDKPGYLADIPRTFSYLLNVVSKTPELEPVAVWLRERLTPVLLQSEHFEKSQIAEWVKA